MEKKDRKCPLIHKEHNHTEHQILFFESGKNSAVFLEEDDCSEILDDYPHFQINADNQISFYESLKEFISYNTSAKRIIVIINTSNITWDNQKRLVPLVKDRTYMCTSLSDNCQIIVTGHRDAIIGELFGLLICV